MYFYVLLLRMKFNTRWRFVYFLSKYVTQDPFSFEGGWGFFAQTPYCIYRLDCDAQF